MEIYQAGLDASRYQGKIDWQRVAEEGKQFAIIRAVSSDAADVPYEDSCFCGNVRAAAAAGLRVGAYYYTYAHTTAYADKELAVLRRVLAGCKLQYPVFINVEDDSLRVMGKKDLTALVLYALENLRAAGYYPGVYTYTDFLLDCLDETILREYPLFLADYGAIVNYEGSYQMLQYTDFGLVCGVDERVDLDVAYVDFLPTIQTLGLNNYQPADTPVAMLPMEGVSLTVYGAKPCLACRTANVNDAARRLEAGEYPVRSQTQGSYNGHCWATVYVNGEMFWVPLLADRCCLTR